VTAVVELDEPTRAVAPRRDEQQEDHRETLPWRGITALASSAGFAVWTSLTCFVC